jgi:transcriptional regulator with XRE-family HTH domain
MRTPNVTEQAELLGHALRARRKALGVSMVAAAEAAGISRVTWHRLEKGVTTVATGSLLAAAQVLGMRLFAGATGAASEGSCPTSDYLPLRIRVAEHPQLQRLAWQLDADAVVLAPREAFDLYQRNWRHLDVTALMPAERSLIQALRATFGGDWPGV